MQDATVGQLVSGLEHHFRHMKREHRADLAILACLLHACLLHHHRTLKPSPPDPSLQQTQSTIINKNLSDAPASNPASDGPRNSSRSDSRQPSASSFQSIGSQSSSAAALPVAAGSKCESMQGQTSTLATAKASGNNARGLQAWRPSMLHAAVPKLSPNVQQDPASEAPFLTAEAVVSQHPMQQQQGSEAATSGRLRRGAASCHPSSWLCDGVPSAGFLLQVRPFFPC